MLVQKTKKKTGLSVTNVSRDHWSFGGNKAKFDGTRLVVTVLRGKGLLASDVLTGKSDPISFVWCGPSEVSVATGATNDDFMDTTDERECIERGIFRTQVCPRTLEPVWNEDIIFPLSITDSYSLSHLRCVIYVRDEDIDDSCDDDSRFSYDDLGICDISIKDILMNGKVGKQSIVLVSKQLDLGSSPKMKKTAEGYLKVTFALIFDEKDTKRMFSEIADDINGLGDFLQKYQSQLRERHEKDNGPQALWGGNTASISTRRSLAEEGTGETTGRSTSRSRSARTRPSNLSMQVAPRVHTSAKGDLKLTATGSARSNERVVPYLNLGQRQEHNKNRIAEEEKEVHLEEIIEGNEEDEEMHIIGTRRDALRSLSHGTDSEDKSVTPPLLPKRVELSAVQPGAARRYADADADDVCKSKTDMDLSLLIVHYDKNYSQEQGQAQRGEDETKEGEGERQGQGQGAVPASPRLEVRVDRSVSNGTNESRKISQRGQQHTGNGRMIGSKITAIPSFRYEKKVREGQSDTHGGALIVRDIGAVQGNATAAARALRDREDTHVDMRGEGQGAGKQQGSHPASAAASTVISKRCSVFQALQQGTNREGADGSSRSRQKSIIDGTASSPTPHCDRSSGGGSGSGNGGPGSGDIASTSTSTRSIVTESIDGDVARTMKSEECSLAAKHDLKLFKKRRQAEMRRRAVEEVENGEDSYEDDRDSILVRQEALPPPYAQLSVQGIPPAEKIEERKLSGRLIPDALMNPKVRSQSKNSLVPSLNLASCRRNTRSNLASAPTTTTTITTVPSTITATVTAAAAAAAFGSLDSHSGEEEEQINIRGGQVKNYVNEKDEQKEKEREREMRDIRCRSDKMPLRTGSILSPIAIDPSLTSSVPSPPPNLNVLESIRGVTGRSCHVDWSAIEQLFRDDDVVGAFSLVLERGELEDLVLAMEMLGPRPDLLSASLRNRVYDGIATILAGSCTAGKRDGGDDRHTEECLLWISALFRSSSSSSSSSSSIGVGGQSTHTGQQGGCKQPQKSLFTYVPGHTRRDLKESLQQVSLSRSKKGLLAALLLHYF